MTVHPFCVDFTVPGPYSFDTIMITCLFYKINISGRKIVRNGYFGAGQGKVRVASCELQVASCELRVASCELQVASCELQVAKANIISQLDWLQSLILVFINVSYHILLARFTLMALS